MAATEPQPIDAGAPYPRLAPASCVSMYGRPVNETQRRHIAAFLEDLYHELLCRGTYADVSLSFKIVDGVIQQDLWANVTNHYRLPLEE
jgi:hypothetical protein